MKTIKQLLFVALAVAMVSVAVMGQANKLQDLIRSNASSGQNAMEQRGYVLTHAERKGNSIYAYWWNQSARKCVCVRAMNNEFKSVVDTEPFDCNQNADSGMSTGAKVGVGVAAAAIIGAIALAHKAHQHDDDKHYETVQQESEFDRGYRDGLHNSAYHNYSDSKEYAKGYTAGFDQRTNNLSHSTGRGGYRPHVNVADLQGARASAGESDMQSRGFRNVDGFKSGNTSYTIWWNGRTGQCIQVGTWDGRYGSVMDIETHPKCM